MSSLFDRDITQSEKQRGYCLSIQMTYAVHNDYKWQDII